MNNQEEKLLELIASLADTEERELDCDEFLARVSAYVESLENGVEVSDRFYQEARHLRLCANCREEFDALLAMLKAE